MPLCMPALEHPLIGGLSLPCLEVGASLFDENFFQVTPSEFTRSGSTGSPFSAFDGCPPISLLPEPYPAKTDRIASENVRFSSAGPSVVFGSQAGICLPASNDLRETTPRLGFAVGLHATWPMARHLNLRLRLDHSHFSPGIQIATLSNYTQRVEAQVSSLALGLDCLWSAGTRWSMGLGLSGVRWSVSSKDVFISGNGIARADGFSRAWRAAAGPVLTYRLHHAFTLEGRWSHSRYGMENAQANTSTIGLLWQFRGVE